MLRRYSASGTGSGATSFAKSFEDITPTTGSIPQQKFTTLTQSKLSGKVVKSSFDHQRTRATNYGGNYLERIIEGRPGEKERNLRLGREGEDADERARARKKTKLDIPSPAGNGSMGLGIGMWNSPS